MGAPAADEGPFGAELGDLGVPGVGDPEVAVGVQGDVKGPFFFSGFGDGTDVFAFFVQLLDPLVAAVGDVDVAFGADRDAFGEAELGFAGASRAELLDEGACGG